MSPIYPTPGRRWERYVAIGDSFTEGMCDDVPGRPGEYAGWADRLAGHLAHVAAATGGSVSYANLAVRGRLLGDVVGPQLETALALGPDLVSIVGGGNDMLRPSADVRMLAASLGDAVARLRSAGADVLLVTSTDTTSAGPFRPLLERHAAYTAHIHALARAYGAYVADQFTFRALQDWRMWADDRLHMNSEGHRRVALLALDALGHDTGPSGPSGEPQWRVPLPPQEPLARRDAALAHAAWLRDHAGPWVSRRIRGESMGDGILPKRPQLTQVTPLAP
jgi:lysophospholipase L1-like esterase